MDCYVLQNHYLEFIEGKVCDSSYEFACELQEHNIKQYQVSYFTIDLDQMYANSKEIQLQKSQNMIVGIIFHFQEHISTQIKNFICSCLKDNIYFQEGKYMEGFSNLILATQDFFKSSESQFSQKLIDYHMVNLMLKIGENMYVTKSFSQDYQLKNKWIAKFGSKFENIREHPDILIEHQNFYQINKNYVRQMKEIILSSNQSDSDLIIDDIRTKYPRQAVNDIAFHTFFLKIKF